MGAVGCRDVDPLTRVYCRAFGVYSCGRHDADCRPDGPSGWWPHRAVRLVHAPSPADGCGAGRGGRRWDGVSYREGLEGW